ncbi:MAG TPA: hypothetical protein DCS11_04930 [Syntrophus sp. (in: bacteria)]|nr:hypothetical protein [Syntrophus sp. (in: bacteria)]
MITVKPSLMMNLLVLLAMRLREFTLQVENLSLREIPGRLVAHLLHLSREQGDRDVVALNLSKARLANLLGAGPESPSRALGSLKRKGLVEEDGPRLRLLDRDRLEALAEMGKDAG